MVAFAAVAYIFIIDPVNGDEAKVEEVKVKDAKVDEKEVKAEEVKAEEVKTDTAKDADVKDGQDTGTPGVDGNFTLEKEEKLYGA